MAIIGPLNKKSNIVLMALSHYKHNESMGKYLAHISALPLPENWKWEVIVCDNSGDFEGYADSKLNLKVYHPGENKHYLGGCWFALKKWHEENGNFPEWIVVTNHDLVFEQGFFLKLLSKSFNEKIAVVAPDIRTPYGAQQNPHLRYRPSRYIMQLKTIAFRHSSLYLLMDLQYRLKTKLKAIIKPMLQIRIGEGSKYSSEHLMPIYAAHGCAFFFRRAFFEHGGSLASKGVAFHEEFLVAERSRRMGLQVIWDPNLHLFHHENVTMKLTSFALQMQWMRRLSDILMDIYSTGEEDTWFRNI